MKEEYAVVSLFAPPDPPEMFYWPIERSSDGETITMEAPVGLYAANANANLVILDFVEIHD